MIRERYRVLPPERAAGRRVLTGDEMRRADAHTIHTLGIPSACLMENAGRHVALVAAERCPPGRPIGLVCGRGNNGGDALVAARHLADWGHRVDLLVCAEADRTTPPACWPAGDRLSPDAALQLHIAQALGLPIHFVVDPQDFPVLPAPGHYGLLVDGLLGTGLSGSVSGLAAEAVAWMNGHGCDIVAIDIPSGICSETGQVLGTAVRAAATVTFAVSKLGHWLFPGAAHTGALTIADIGIPEAALAGQGPERRLLTTDDLRPAFARRPRDGHKGTFGHVYVLAGSPGRTGAARMAADAALRAGAGLVTVGTGRDAFRMLAAELYEAMSEVALEPGEVPVSAAERLANRLNRCQAAVIGPGLPADPELGEVLALALARIDVPAVVDAEALNLLAWRKEALEGAGPRVITPHPGEAARLLGRTNPEIQADRVGAARTLAEETGAIVVLKGAHTLVAAPDGRLALCPDGNPGMGSGGMGDVLAGVIGALLARGLPAMIAACAGVVWHARAGDLAAARLTETGLLARDVIASLGEVEKQTC